MKRVTQARELAGKQAKKVDMEEIVQYELGMLKYQALWFQSYNKNVAAGKTPAHGFEENTHVESAVVHFRALYKFLTDPLTARGEATYVYELRRTLFATTKEQAKTLEDGVKIAAPVGENSEYLKEMAIRADQWVAHMCTTRTVDPELKIWDFGVLYRTMRDAIRSFLQSVSVDINQSKWQAVLT